MPRSALLEWEGKEYEHTPKSADWYWALGILAAALAVACTLFGSYLLAVLIVVAAGALALHSAKHPPTHLFRLTEQGLVIDEDLHPFARMASFAVLEDIEGNEPPLLSVKNDTWLSPHLVVPLAGVDADALYAYFLAHVDEGEHHHTTSDLVAAWLGL